MWQSRNCGIKSARLSDNLSTSGGASREPKSFDQRENAETPLERVLKLVSFTKSSGVDSLIAGRV